MIYDLGDGVSLRHLVYDADGTLTAATVALVVTKPDGSTTVSPSVSTSSTGVYDAATFTTDAAGLWTYVWTVSGAVVDKAAGSFTVADPAPPSYVSLALLKQALKITDTDRDALLNQALLAASRGVDAHCGRRFYADRSATARTWPTRGRTVRNSDGELLLVDDIATTTGLVVEVGDGTTWTAVTDYFAEPDNALARGDAITALRRDMGYWSGSRRVRVTARWGWPAVPDPVAQATLILALRLFRRKDSPEGVTGSAEFGLIRVTRIDPDVQGQLAHLVLPGIG